MNYKIMSAAGVWTITAILLAVDSLQAVAAQDVPPPTSLKINIEQPLSAGRTYEIKCTAAGWETPLNISWWLGGRQLLNATEQVSETGNETISTLLLSPKPSDNDKVLACRADHKDGYRDTTVTLDVYFAPFLEHRYPLSTQIEEGSNIYFTCTIKANPGPYIGRWLYKGRGFEHSPCLGVYWLNEGSAAIERVTRQEAGDYTCMAANVEGETTSVPLRITIIYKPQCNGSREQVFAVPRGERLRCQCVVDALPPVEGYRWVFNSTTRNGNYSTEWRGGTWQRNHTPFGNEGYGSLYCWARNALGEQEQPCVFHVVPPGPPEDPTNCSVTNRAHDFVVVKCAEGFDGGHHQKLLLEAFDVTSGRLLYNETRLDGAFLVDDLEPRTWLHLRVTAFSPRGRSQTITLATSTLGDTELEDEEREELSNCSVLNRTSQSLMMVCLGGFDNDRTQNFLSEVFDSTAGHLFTRTVQKHQIVMVNGLATKHQRRMRLLADSFNGQIAAVMMDFHVSVAKDVTVVEPQSTNILLGQKWMVAGETVEVTCSTEGSQPPAYVTWWLENQRLFDTVDQVSEDGSETVSIVRLTPSRLDDKAMLTCRSENPQLPTSAQEHSVRLNVCYPPKVSLYLERPMRTDDIREGDNVSLHCQVQSNPPPWMVQWLFQGRLLQEIHANGTLNETLTLSLDSINSTRTGDYCCVVSNAIGDKASVPLRLTIKHRPVCRSQQPQVLRAPQGGGVPMDCKVDSVPPADGYRWMFNSSLEGEGTTLSFLEWTSGGSRRVHKPANDMDYGTFHCWAYNAIGLQQEPCVFHVVAPGRPTAPSNCSVSNKTSESFTVRCPASTDEGRRQSYRLEVFDVATGHTVANQTQWLPVFHVTHLWPKRPMTLRVAAISSRGLSKWVRLNTFTLAPRPATTPMPVIYAKHMKQKNHTSHRGRQPHCGHVNHKRPCLRDKVPRL